ncbi:MAG: phosphoglucomutase [Treponema sp.]|nr:phosphoglucomutase [Treponema sp.]
MILSASGWRKVFVESGDENDSGSEIGDDNSALVAIAANTFIDYIVKKTGNRQPSIVLGRDTRPTGTAIADIMIRIFSLRNIPIQYIGIAAAPEIMAYSKTQDGFVYISASHNPIGHNGIKFGLGDGGVLSAAEATLLAEDFKTRCEKDDAIDEAVRMVLASNDEEVDWFYAESMAYKKAATAEYHNFSREVISATKNANFQNYVFSKIRQRIKYNSLGIVVDMNGSARTMSIDKSFFEECGITYYGINDNPGQIVHEIIPEPENLVYCAREMERLQKEGHEDAILGYMPDCDGDRGNIVYWDSSEKKAKVLKAQEVFSLSVLAELSFMTCVNEISLQEMSSLETSISSEQNLAIAVNGPTSMRIDEIAKAFNAKVYRAEVGEANVVNLARALRQRGYDVRILGEGSNGGTITHPAAVRDPLNTIFALVKLLTIRDFMDNEGCMHKGLFHIWCDARGIEESYDDNFKIEDIIKTLPVYTTTGVSEKRAVLHIKTSDHGILKGKFQKLFESSWKKNLPIFKQRYGIESYKAVCTNGVTQKSDISDFSISGKGGLKVIFYDKNNEAVAFIWMRGSGTEPVFRIMCDVKGHNPKLEHLLLEWETRMLNHADKD